jgi:putative oxidoreductase
MDIVRNIPRILLGLMFLIFGINGFVPFIPNPPSIPPLALEFFGTMVRSHFSYFVFGVQTICGVLLLVNRYVPLALVTLAAVLANIVAFHVTMWPATLVPMPVIAIVLWFLVAWPLRRYFSPLLSATLEQPPAHAPADASAPGGVQAIPRS